jgi:hypothetical protein
VIDTSAAPPASDEAPYRRLRTANLGMGSLHAIQAVLILVLANAFALPVTASFMTGPPGSTPEPPTTLFEIPTAWAVAAFFVLSALAHFLVAAPGINGWYADNLRRGRNYARWIEYSLSSSLMIVLIAQLTGITDVAALIALFGVNASMILFGLLQEHDHEQGGSLLPFWLGCIAGIVPWVAIVVYALSPGLEGTPPAFVIAIFISLFAFFNCFALVQWAQYKPVGRYRNYLTGERTYIVLSLVAKSALAWQVFSATLAG